VKATSLAGSPGTLGPLPGRTRILVASSPWTISRFIPTVFTELVGFGAELVFAAEAGKDPVPAELRDSPQATAAQLPIHREGDAGESVKLLRRMIDLNRFYDPRLVDSSWARHRTAVRALVSAGYPDARTAAEELASQSLPANVHAALTRGLGAIERQLPPPPQLVAAVEELGVDAILLVSRCSLGGSERDVLKVAQALDLPTTMLVWSWDNLSSKALLNEHPDRMLVWNERQVEEAVELHGFRREHVQALGAPNFDRFFVELEEQRTHPRPSRDRKTILYLGSSKNVCKQEPDVFLRWVAAVRASEDSVVRDARVVVRPYPGGGGWRRWRPDATDEFEVEPARKLEPGRLAGLLLDADVVVALNTSAELEAALAGRPVVTFRAGELAPGQEGSIHFEYLLEQHGGFVIDSRDLDEHVGNLARVLTGEADTGSLTGFAERFVRPEGLERPVSPLVAAAVLEYSRRAAPERPRLVAR
jgi:hypothetical protein